MNYSDVVQFFQTKSMQQDEMIDCITAQLYDNNYSLLEKIIEEYVLGLNEEELKTLEQFINTNLTD